MASKKNDETASPSSPNRKITKYTKAAKTSVSRKEQSKTFQPQKAQTLRHEEPSNRACNQKYQTVKSFHINEKQRKHACNSSNAEDPKSKVTAIWFPTFIPAVLSLIGLDVG